MNLLNDCDGNIVIVDSFIPLLFMLPNGDIVSYGSLGYWGDSSGDTFYSSY